LFGLSLSEFFSGLFAIVLFDLLLAGDNAVVIGMAARNLPKEVQKKAIILGTGGAIIIRILVTILVVYLLEIKGLKLIGGVMLVYIAIKLLLDKKEEHKEIKADTKIWKAIGTIVLADAVMGLDNVLAIAGASHGSPAMVILGLLISIPIMVYGSTLIIKLLDRFPWVVYLGAGILAWTAGHMMVDDPFVVPVIESAQYLEWLVGVVLVILVVGLGYWLKSREQRKQAWHDQQAEPTSARDLGA